MRGKINYILIIILIFIINIGLIDWALTNIVYMYPENNKMFTEANITKHDLAFFILQKNLPDEKNEKFMTLSGADLNKTKGAILKFILIPSAILTGIMFLIIYSLLYSRKIKKDERKHKDEEKRRRDEYLNKYKLSNSINTYNCSDSIYYNDTLKGKKLIIWFEDNSINMINSDFHKDIGKIIINYNDIFCFSRYGDFYTSTNVQGGGTNFDRALLGYVIAGGVGAVVASREPINSKTTIHDKRETLVIIKGNEQEAYLFFEPEFYNVLMHQIPNKEVSYITKNTPKGDEKNNLDRLMQLGEMKDKGYINQEEFDKLKKELIG